MSGRLTEHNGDRAATDPSSRVSASGRRPAAVRPNGAAAVRPNKILTTRVGLRFPNGVTFDDWERAGAQLARVVDAWSWCLGDWLVYGQRRYSDRYRAAVAAVGLDYQTLRNYAWVTGRFEFSRRRASLSFQHHAEVAALSEDEQELWLERAEKLGWSRNQLREAIRDARQGFAPGGSRMAVMPRVKVSSDSVERWRKAAEQARSDLRQWVVETLDAAALRELTASMDSPPSP